MDGSKVAVVADSSAAATVLHPLRLKILGALREPDSAAGVARRLNLPRQRVNYHVRELAHAGLLDRAGQRRRGNMTERRYVATARSYVLSPELLGRLGLDASTTHDAFSATHLLALILRAQGDMARALRRADGSRTPLSTFSISCEIRFQSADERRWFAEELQRAVLDVVDRCSSPATDGAGAPAPGQLQRVIVGVYPVLTGEEG